MKSESKKPKMECKTIVQGIDYCSILYSRRWRTLYAYDITTGNIDHIHDKSWNISTLFISMTPHSEFVSKYSTYMKISFCNKFLMILRPSENRRKKGFYIDIRGIGANMGGFSSSILEIEGDNFETIIEENEYQSKDISYLSSPGPIICPAISDFCYIGGEEIIVINELGNLSLWKFSRLEVAECITRTELPLIKGERCCK